MMTQEKIYNVETGETTFVPISAERLQEIELGKIEIAKRQADAAEKEAKRQIAVAKLTALGLDADDLAALGL